MIFTYESGMLFPWLMSWIMSFNQGSFPWWLLSSFINFKSFDINVYFQTLCPQPVGTEPSNIKTLRHCNYIGHLPHGCRLKLNHGDNKKNKDTSNWINRKWEQGARRTVANKESSRRIMWLSSELAIMQCWIEMRIAYRHPTLKW
jgi:hypothetical protein